MTATLGPSLVSEATLYVERHGIPHGDLAMIDDTVLAPGSSQTLTIGTLAMTGGVVASGGFGGQARAHWSGGVVGLDAKGNGTSAWSLSLPSRPYHNDGGIMLSVVLADLERDAAAAAGASPLGTTLEVPDVRLDAAGAWLRPSAIGRDLLDALAVAGGLARGSWWIDVDGSTHLGPRPASQVTLSDLTIPTYDPALLRAVVALSSDDYASLVPGVTLTAPGLPAPLTVAALVVHVTGDDIGAELWGEASHAELLARIIRHVMAPSITYLPPHAYTTAGAAEAGTGRVPVMVPEGSPFPDAPLLGHAPGIPGASFVLAPGAAVLVSCVEGSPGNPVCTSYPGGGSIPLPLGVTFDVQPGSKITFGATAPLPLVVAVNAQWFTEITAAMAAIKAGTSTGLSGLLSACAGLTVPVVLPTIADKAQASHV